jgi:hypothetical protein
LNDKGGSTSRELQIAKAKLILHQFPCYNGLLMPAFSNGWLEGFKNRNYIKSRVLHSEAVSLGVDAEEMMVENRKIISQYKEEDIFNMDKIGLFWNLLPSRGLLIEPQPSVKKEKARISINLCSNATGSERIRP